MDRGDVRAGAGHPADTSAPPPLLPCPGPAASETSSTTRATRSSACSARACRSVLSGTSTSRTHGASRLSRQHWDGLLAPASREHAALLQRDRDQRPPRLRPRVATRSTGRADHPVSTETSENEKHRPDRAGGDDARMTARRRAVVIVDGEHTPPVVRAALEKIEDVSRRGRALAARRSSATTSTATECC